MSADEFKVPITNEEGEALIAEYAKMCEEGGEDEPVKQGSRGNFKRESRPNKIKQLAAAVSSGENAMEVQKRKRGFVKGNKLGPGRGHKKQSPQAVAQKEKFSGRCKFYMDNGGFDKARAIAENKNHPRQLDAIKFMAAYGYGLPTATLNIENGPAELKQTTQEKLNVAFPFVLDGGKSGAGVSAIAESPEQVGAGGVSVSSEEGSSS
jgi:hypothetical protein